MNDELKGDPVLIHEDEIKWNMWEMKGQDDELHWKDRGTEWGGAIEVQ